MRRACLRPCCPHRATATPSATCQGNKRVCTVPYCTVPYCTVPYCTVPYCTIPYYTIPLCTIPLCNGSVKSVRATHRALKRQVYRMFFGRQRFRKLRILLIITVIFLNGNIPGKCLVSKILGSKVE